jgi:glyoxylase-like metal-dependent hydrolase (beta-lactamase superfamily II)
MKFSTRRKFCQFRLFVFISAVTASGVCSDLSGGARQDASDRLHEVLSSLANSIGNSGAEVYISGTEFAPEQARDPQTPILEVPAKQRILLAPDGRYLLQTEELFPGNVVFRFRTVGSTEGSATIDELKWRTGTEIQRSSAQEAKQDYGDLLLLSPAMLAADALKHPMTLVSTNAMDNTLKGSYTDSIGRSVSIVVDPGSRTIVSVTANSRHYRYEAWRTVHGLPQPSRIVGNTGGADAVWSDVDAFPITSFAAGEFAIPPGYVDETVRLNLRLSSLGGGAYRVDGAPSGYHSSVVVGSDCIALFDPSISLEEATTVRTLVEKNFPGRPIRYVILSHVHGDHTRGLPIYFNSTVKILAGAGAQIALKRQFPNMNLAQIEELNLPTAIDLGGTKLQLYPMPSTHASTMVVGYDPRSRTIFQGDLFFLPEVGPTPPAFEGAEELSSLISKYHLDVNTIVGVHGRSGGKAYLVDSLELRHAGRSLSTEPSIVMPSRE